MAMGFIEILMLIVLNGGGGTDLLDYVPTRFYWKHHSVLAVTPEAMANVLADEEADNVDRLMAIRTLGELGDDAAAALLTPLVDSDEPFVAGYARRSLAWLGGQDPGPMAVLAEDALAQDLALLPVETQIVGQSRGLSVATGPQDLKSLLPDIDDADELAEEFALGLLDVIEQVGNLRLDAITLGMSFTEDDDDPVMVTVIARGLYDRQRILRLMEEEPDVELFSINDIEAASITEEWGEQFLFLMPSDERFVFMFSGMEGIQFPIDETAMLIEDGETEPMLGGVLLDELEHIDRATTAVWLAMEVPAMLKQNEPGEVFGAFDAMRFVGEADADGNMAVTAFARGEDAGAVAQTVDVIRGYIAEGIMAMEEEMQFQPEMAGVFEPMLASLRSIELSAEGTTARGTMTVPTAQGGFFQMLFLGF